jgi:hypothetical protein
MCSNNQSKEEHNKNDLAISCDAYNLVDGDVGSAAVLSGDGWAVCSNS